MDDVRDRILLRRAAFLAASLAACRAPGPAAEPVAVAIPEARDGGPVPALPEPDAGPADARPKAPAIALPSFELPAGLSPSTQERYENLFSRTRSAASFYDKIDAALPEGCSPLHAGCEAAWRSVAGLVNDLRRSRLYAYDCPGTSPEAKAYGVRAEEHRRYVEAREAALQARIDRASGGNPAGRERVEQLVQEAYQSSPYPCLSIACRDW